MLEKTKELFDAPYKVCETRNGYNVICTNKVLPQLCWTTDKKDANRMARLPELYDALLEAAYEHCHYCVELESENEYVPPSSDFIKYGCPKKSQSCFCRRWWDVLRKVEAGE